VHFRRDYLPYKGVLVFVCLIAAIGSSPVTAQQNVATSTAKPSAPQTPPTPAQIELLETKVRFEPNGDSRKEVHCIVKINSELGVRQFARLNFDYNRSFEKIEIPFVRVTHSSGGTADILPSAITDNPNPAVVSAPAYQDVRVKSVRILGLEPSDTLEYRVIATVSHHPLAPEFWFDHSFDRSGVVTRESFEIDLPALEQLQMRIAPDAPASSTSKSGTDKSARTIYLWNRSQAHDSAKSSNVSAPEPDLLFSTWASSTYMSTKLEPLLTPSPGAVSQVAAKAAEIIQGAKTQEEKLEAIYEFVSQKISTVDLPLGATGFRTRLPSEIISSGMATEEDKFALFSALAPAAGFTARAFLAGAPAPATIKLIGPKLFSHLLIEVQNGKRAQWLDPSLEVAPLAMIPAEFRGKQALLVEDWSKLGKCCPLADIMVNAWRLVPDSLPFKAAQNVSVNAALAGDGKLTAKVKYTMRGDNELLLRVAFHQSAREKWNEVAQLLALSDGFRGKIVNVSASDPYATREPFTVEYEIMQPKFVDWSKKPVRIPAILPLVGLPDPPASSANGSVASHIELGTPLNVETSVVLHLPPNTTAQTPAGTSVERDYATFSSQYAAHDGIITASRNLNFLLREIPATRAADYNAFLHAIQNDQAQLFTLDLSNTTPASSPSTPK